jgi:mRNA interferase YafQ
MTSKKVVKGREAALPRRSEFTKELRKDWRGLQHSGINLASLKEAMCLLIANEGDLPPEWGDHPLRGRLAGYRECHAGGDLLLIYELRDEGQTIVFIRAGTHAELFE